MQRPTTRNDRDTRPYWWLLLLSLCAVCLLMVPPAQMCALMEAMPDHAYSRSSSHAVISQHDGHYTATPAAGLSSVPVPHACCCSADSTPVVVVAGARFTALDEAAPPSSPTATLPLTPDIFARVRYHERDGPPSAGPLRAQFFAASLLGRAPPLFA